jgi:hypothetical protein
MWNRPARPAPARRDGALAGPAAAGRWSRESLCCVLRAVLPVRAHAFGLSDPPLQPFQVMILDVFDRDDGSCCIDEYQPPRIEDKGASRENPQLGRIDSIDLRAHGTEPSFRLCLIGLVPLALCGPPLHLGAAARGALEERYAQVPARHRSNLVLCPINNFTKTLELGED